MCIAPVNIPDKTGVSVYSYLQVPCGKCHECRARRSAAWAFRLEQEDRVHLESHFVTLTYSDDNLSGSDDGLPTLVKSDLQKFFKRLRKNSQKKIKYYACGEYGTSTLRPHYHAIIFGAGATDIDRAWGDIGNIHYGDISKASIRYVTNYLCKSVDSDIGDRCPEFALMSKGLGSSYISSAIIHWHESNLANYVVNAGGIRQALPRYYKEKIFDENQRKKFGIEHVQKLDELTAEKVKKFGFAETERQKTVAIKAAVNAANYLQKKRNKI